MSRKKSNDMTEKDLREYAAEHICYELNMLLASASLCQANTPSNSLIGFPIHNAALESFCIHARNLINFLYPENSRTKDTDVTILNYIISENIQKYRPKMSDILKNTKINADKQMAHLTTERYHLFSKPENRIWNFGDISKEIIRVFNKLEPYFEEAKVYPETRLSLESNWKIYLFKITLNQDGSLLFEYQ